MDRSVRRGVSATCGFVLSVGSWRLGRGAAVSATQWDLLSDGDSELSREEPAVHDRHPTTVHTHLHVRLEAQPLFTEAAKRHLQATPAPISLLQFAPHPGFGSVSATAPRRPRYLVLHNDSVRDPDSERWVGALERMDNVLAEVAPPYSVEYRVVYEGGDADISRLPDSAVVASEMLNARSRSDVGTIQALLLDHAKSVVNDGAACKFQVLQALGQPAFFKTIEVYNGEPALASYMSQYDPSFEAACLPCRAAVNRVRQAYRPVSR